MTMLPTMLEEEVARCSVPEGEEAGFGALSTAKGRLPLRAMDVRGRIDGLLAQVTVSQTFVNATDEPLEATYIFPLPDRAAVTRFRMEVAGRVVEGVLEERAQARLEYDRAIKAGQRASIAEEERPGVFALRVGNLLPSEEATVVFSMAGVLPYHRGEVTFRFPLVVAPRYIPGIALPGGSVGDGVAVDTDAVPDASRISPPVLLPGFPNPVRLALTIDLHGDFVAIEQVRSSLHATWTEESEGVRRVRVEPGSRLDRDFILRFRLAGNSVRSTLSLHPDSGVEGAGTFALTVVPPNEVQGASARPRDVAFVLDRSGSMGGWKMVAARRALARMVDTLGDDDRFCVYAFDDEIEAPEANGFRLVAGNNRNRFRAVEFLAKVEARGGTEMAEPLEKAARGLREGAPGRDRVLVLVTDGQVGHEDQVLRTLGGLWEGVRCFTLGIDRAVNEGFLRRLAELGGGSCELVESEERLDEVMESIHRHIGTPVLTGLTLDCDGLEIEAGSLVPGRVPDLFAGSPLLLLGRYRGRPRGPVVVRAAAAGARGASWQDRLAPSLRPNPAIAFAWARGQVRKLEDRLASGQGNRAALEREIVETSLRYGVLCRFTAFVAVDRARVVNEGGQVHRVTQPVEAPSGWERSGDVVAACFALPAESPVAVGPSFGESVDSYLSVFEDDALDDDDSCAFALDERADPDDLELLVEASEGVPSSAGPLADLERIEVVGRGGMGTVYKGYDRQRDRVVAVKVLAEDRPGRFDDFEARAASLSRLGHPAIVRPLEVTRLGGQVFVVSEYVAGPSLLERQARDGRLDPCEAARLVAQVADAVQDAHDHGLVLGTLTSNDIRIGDDGSPRLLGFDAGPGPGEGFLGNPAYVAPELLRGDSRPTERADIYSLGVILYRLLTGELPSRGGGLQQIAAALKGAIRPPRSLNPDVPPELEAICLKALARDPAARYGSARELAEALAGIPSPPDASPGSLRRNKKRLSLRKTPRPGADPEAPGAGRREGFWK